MKYMHRLLQEDPCPNHQKWVRGYYRPSWHYKIFQVTKLTELTHRIGGEAVLQTWHYL